MTPSAGLALPTSAALPAWLPDEIFFSLASRYHDLAANRLADHTTLALFGHRRQGSQHDFPSRLGEFASRTAGMLGAAEEIARDRTILRYYLPLRPESEQRAALQALVAGPDPLLKYCLGIVTSRFGANHPLKACPGCMADDLARFGVAYWHRRHQFPGVWVCLDHDCLLQVSPLKATGMERFSWILPKADQLHSPVGATLTTRRLDALKHLATMIEHWVSLPDGFEFDTDVLAATYRLSLPEGPTGRGSARRMQLAHAYADFVQDLRVIPELAELPASAAQAVSLLDRWVFNPRGGTHPLRHLTLIAWLFRDWTTFMDRYQDCASAALAPARTEPMINAEVVDPRRATFLGLIRGGDSIRSAALAVGVTANTGIAWAAAAGVGVKRRPQSIDRTTQAAIIERLRAGLGKSDAASHYGVSIQAITRLLRSEPGLRKAWQAARNTADREKARCAWLAAVSRTPGIGVGPVRAEVPSAYAWLYRNDRQWLIDNSAAARQTARDRPHVRLDWDARDHKLADEVRRAAADLLGQTTRTHLRLSELFAAVPTLKAKVNALDHLPLTQQAVREVTRRRKARSTRQQPL